MDDRRWDWVEIVEPRSRDRMYANLLTGECVWQPPPGVNVKKMHDDQWWELFDQKTSRYYYYNATSQKTVWHRPHNSDIIPLAKLQHAKQAAELSDATRSKQSGSGGSNGGSSSLTSSGSTPTLERKLPEEHIYSNRMAAVAARNMHSSHVPPVAAASPAPQRQRNPYQYQTSAPYDKVDLLLNNGVAPTGPSAAAAAPSAPRRGSLTSSSVHGGSNSSGLVKPDLSAMNVGYEPHVLGSASGTIYQPHVGAAVVAVPESVSSFSRDSATRASGHARHQQPMAGSMAAHHYPQALMHPQQQQVPQKQTQPQPTFITTDSGRDYVNRSEFEHHRRGSLDASVPFASAPAAAAQLVHRGSLRAHPPSTASAAVPQQRSRHHQPLVQSTSLSFVEQQQQLPPSLPYGSSLPHADSHSGRADVVGSGASAGGSSSMTPAGVRARPRLGLRAQPRTNPMCKPSAARPNVLQLSGSAAPDCSAIDDAAASSPVGACGGGAQSPAPVVGSAPTAAPWMLHEHASWGGRRKSYDSLSGFGGYASGSTRARDSPPSLLTSGFGSRSGDIAEPRGGVAGSGSVRSYHEAGVSTGRRSEATGSAAAAAASSSAATGGSAAADSGSDLALYVNREAALGKLSGSENMSADSTPSSEMDSVFWSSVSSLGTAKELPGGGSTWDRSVHTVGASSSADASVRQPSVALAATSVCDAAGHLAVAPAADPSGTGSSGNSTGGGSSCVATAVTPAVGLPVVVVDSRDMLGLGNGADCSVSVVTTAAASGSAAIAVASPDGSSDGGATVAARSLGGCQATSVAEPLYMNSALVVGVAARDQQPDRVVAGLVQPLAPVTQASSEARLSHLSKDAKDASHAFGFAATEPSPRRRHGEAVGSVNGSPTPPTAAVAASAAVATALSTTMTAAEASTGTQQKGLTCARAPHAAASAADAGVLTTTLPPSGLAAYSPDVAIAPAAPPSGSARDPAAPARDPAPSSLLPATTCPSPVAAAVGGCDTVLVATTTVVDGSDGGSRSNRSGRSISPPLPYPSARLKGAGDAGGSTSSIADLTFYEQRSRTASFASLASAASSVSLSACSTSAASADGVADRDPTTAASRPVFHLATESPPSQSSAAATAVAAAVVLRRRRGEPATAAVRSAVLQPPPQPAYCTVGGVAADAGGRHHPGDAAGRGSGSDGSESDYVCLMPALTVESTLPPSERTVVENGIRTAAKQQCAHASVLPATGSRVREHEGGSSMQPASLLAGAAAPSDLGNFHVNASSGIDVSCSGSLSRMLLDVSMTADHGRLPLASASHGGASSIVGPVRSDQSIQRSYTEVKAGAGGTATGSSSGRPLSMHLMPPDSGSSSPTLPRSGLHRQHTFAVPQSASKSTSLSRQQGDVRRVQSEVEFYAENYLNKHKKGLFGKTLPPEAMLSWTREGITKPMLRTDDKAVKKDALEVFRLIQCYMGDRKTKATSSSTALEVVSRGWQAPVIRDEIYVQLCRQTSENPKEESMLLGWELIAIALSFFPPSVNFCPLLEHHINRHINDENSEGALVMRLLTQVVSVSHYAQVCKRRLSRISVAGARKGLRKPTAEEVEQAKRSIINPSMFGETLEEIMDIQRKSHPDRKLPWIQTTLSEEVLRLNGAQTEGIFRVPADIDEVNALKLKVDQWQSPPSDSTDPHLPASLLKLWYRELYEPIIPSAMYEKCMEHYADAKQAIKIVDDLPEINKLVLSYLIRFLQVFAAPENVVVTKMDVNNLAMVMAPNCLRCESDDPRVIFENTRKEMGFIRTLIQHMDTDYMQGII